ncbi:MMPL family transporter [Companilactobacillus formosensis]|uniref:MMPL family transporter n=1 Tax=Companilactobacillus formosensis TaxID=1617889 RepID=UPI001FEBF8B2|nr:MMPL family transporter [Companilactobacillus formosensis]
MFSIVAILVGKIKNKYLVALIGWIIVVIAALVMMPNVSQLVRNKGNITLPSYTESQKASKIEKKANGNKSVITYTVVFKNGSGAKLTPNQSTKIDNQLNKLSNEKSLKIKKVMGPSDNAQTKKQLIAKDKTTQLAQVTVKDDNAVGSQVKKLKNQLKISGIKTYVTGADALNDEFSTVTEKGIQKTEVIAIIFIFIVLILVFRSPIVPLISLLNVGVAFVTSLSIVMNLAEKVNFPISNFTQVFLVVVLFGIGTDYNILLYNYFKGALARGLSAKEAAHDAQKHGGRTILYSGISVLIGFSVLSLAKFSFYQSAVGVAIGVLVLLAVLLTLNMFFMQTLGKKMFWPSKVSAGSGKSHIWYGLSRAALAYPVVILGIIAVAAVPFLVNSNSTLNFNNADEVPDSYQAKYGYKVIQSHFSKGMSAPATIYIQSKSKLTSQENLADIDKLTQYLKQEPGVKTVTSATQPGGSKIKSMYLKNQLVTITNGLNTSTKGLEKIKSGLNSASSQLQSANISGSVAQVQELADGTSQLQAGAQQLSSGIDQYTSGVSTVNDGLQSANSQLPTLSSGVSTLTSSSQQLTSGLSQLQSQVSALSGQATQLLTLLQSSGQDTSAAAGEISQLQSAISQLSSGSSAVSSGMNQLQGQIPTLTSGMSQLASGTNTLVASNSTLTSGGQSLATGSATVNSGVQQMNTQLQQMSSQVTQLEEGLVSADSGLETIAKGNTTMKTYLDGLRKSYVGDTFYLPKATIKSKTFKPALDAYMDNNRKIATITLVFKGDPNSETTSKQLKTIQTDMKAQLKHSSLKNAKVAVGGETSQNNDLRTLANGDFGRTALIMTIGIGIALIVVTESILQPMTIIGTLLLAYEAALGITRIFSKSVLGDNLLSWNTPFFTFIMLMALGVDYSIFLMVRFKDEPMPDLKDRMLNAATAIGTVVISAAIILSGTFAALIPSGVTTLIQVALGVIFGLIILVIILPLTLSSLISLTKWHDDRIIHRKKPEKKSAKKDDSEDAKTE